MVIDFFGVCLCLCVCVCVVWGGWCTDGGGVVLGIVVVKMGGVRSAGEGRRSLMGLMGRRSNQGV